MALRRLVIYEVLNFFVVEHRVTIGSLTSAEVECDGAAAAVSVSSATRVGVDSSSTRVGVSVYRWRLTVADKRVCWCEAIRLDRRSCILGKYKEEIIL